VEPGTPGLAAIRETFGERMLQEDGTLDRAALGALVFSDEAAREKLNAIVHPLIREESARLRQAAPSGALVVEDVPLLAESGQAPAYDVVIVVQAPREERIRRMVEDRGWTRQD